MNSERKIDEIYRDLRSHAPPEDVAERLLTELERYFHEGILSHPLVVCSAVNIERCATVHCIETIWSFVQEDIFVPISV
jgi:hypothetical protein